MYKEATKIKFDVMIINLEKSGNERYRKNFLQYFEIEQTDPLKQLCVCEEPDGIYTYPMRNLKNFFK